MIFKCKMCGGTLEIKENETIATCEYCGTKQTLPKLDSEKKASLFDRANHFRMINEYDKALGIYEQILAEEKTDSEVYWSIVLCRYGIEYVEDPSTHKRIPTVNRVQYNSILKDEDYLKALELADSFQKDIYIEEANTINNIQKGILEVSSKEKPFDIFICYKETDENGRRTEDSVIAQDIYKELTNEGYKVFFSRITLEDKIGSAYEPYIFAALNSAKVMLAIGTKKDYFDAVWVKNEWSRYLSLIKQGQKKTLVPCFKNIDPYDLPEEFAYLQAQDLNKLGFMQDLVRGIEKIIPKQTAKAVIENTNIASEDNQIKRAYIYLENGEFDLAESFAEKALDINAENGEAYLVKFLARHKLSDKKKLTANIFDSDPTSANIIKYSSKELVDEIEDILEETYQVKYGHILVWAEDRKKIIINKNELRELIDKLETLSGRKAKKLLEEIRANGDELIKNNIENAYNDAIERFNKAEQKYQYETAKSSFDRLYSYKDSAEYIKKCNDILKEFDYNNALSHYETAKNVNDFEFSAKEFEKLGSYKDSPKLLQECQNKTKQINNKKKGKILIFIAAIIALAMVVLFAIKAISYGRGVKALNDENYGVAYSCFKIAGNYRDAENLKGDAIAKTASGEYNYEGKITVPSTVRAEYIEYFRIAINQWKDVRKIVFTDTYVVGIKNDGGIVSSSNGLHSISLPDTWNNMIDIVGTDTLLVGVRNDGTVLCFGQTHDYQSINEWTNIKSIDLTDGAAVGLRNDGTVILYYTDKSYENCDVSNWTDIKEVCCGNDFIVGLKNDGTIVTTGSIETNNTEIEGWDNIQHIDCGNKHIVALREDGKVLGYGDQTFGQLDIYDWKDIVYITCGSYNTIGIKKDGTAVYAGNAENHENFIKGLEDVGYIYSGSGVIVAKTIYTRFK